MRAYGETDHGGDYLQGQTQGMTLSQVNRNVYMTEMVLKELRAMREDADQRYHERAAERAAVPRWDILIKEVLRWAIPGGVLLATGSLEKALQVVQALK